MKDEGAAISESENSKFLHGRVSFILREVKHDRGQKYIIVPSHANPADVIVFMRDVWKLECPMIVLSLLTGRSTDPEWQSKKTLGAFKSAIKNAAVNTDMWVLTHGMNFGVTRVIGEAYDEELDYRELRTSRSSGHQRAKGDPNLPLILIGICPLSCVLGGCLFQEGGDVCYTIMGGLSPDNQAELEPHHTHYILVDDSAAPTFASYRPVNIRAGIERKMVRSEPFRMGRFTKSLVPIAPVPGGRRHVQLPPVIQQDSSQTVTSGGTLMSPSRHGTEERSSMTITAGAPELSTLHEAVAAAVAADTSPTFADEDKDMLRDVVPVVCMVIGGGLNTLRDVAERARLGIPLLICRGSGFGADTLAYAYEEYGENSDFDGASGIIRRDVTRRLSDAFPNTERATLDECLGAIMQTVNCCCIERVKSHLAEGSVAPFWTTVLSIFDTRNWKTDPTRLHKELLLTLLRCQRARRKYQHGLSREQVHRQLQLLLDWNAPDIAQLEVFDREDMPFYAIPVHIFEQAFVRRKREAFVELFLDRNFQIQRFFTRARVRRWMILNESDFFHEVCINQLLTDQDSLENYDAEDDISPLINLVLYRLTGLQNIFKPIELRTTLNDQQFLRLVMPETQAFTALTIVAALLNRHDLARVLLKRSDSPIPVALFCSMLYRRLSHFCREPFMKRKVREQSTEMSEYAVGMLDLCFNNAEHYSATEMLLQPQAGFNGLTTIQIAYKAKVMEFLSHPLCQRWISEKYYGGLRFLDLSFGPYRLPLIIKVLSCSILLLPTMWWVALDSTDDTTSGTESSQSPPQQRAGADAFVQEKTQQCQSWLQILRKLWIAPVTKFYLSLTAYVLFLFTLGFATLVPSCGNLLVDSLIGIWVCLMIIEIARCTYINYTTYGDHMAIGHNVLDICVQFIFLVLYGWTRLLGNWYGSVSVINSKFVMCLGVLYFTYRVPFVYMAISETLGPQLVWIQYTITHDFADFVKLLLLAIFAGGITINAMVYPFWPFDNTFFSRVVARAFLAMFLTEKADLEYDPNRKCISPNISSNTCIEQASGAHSILQVGPLTPSQAAYAARNLSASCPIQSFGAWLFALQHFILMKLFLMTILYAMFNNSSLSIAKYSSLVWMFKRYETVLAFERTRTLPPPLTVLFYFASFCKYLWNSCPRWWAKLKACLKILRSEGTLSKKTFKRLYSAESDRPDDPDDNLPFGSSGKWNSTGLSKVELGLSGKDGTIGPNDKNYWRLLAQEYIGKREEGLLTTTSESDVDSLDIRAKLLGETVSSQSQSRQVEALKAQVSGVKEHVNLVEKSIDKLNEKLESLQENIGKFSELMAARSSDASVIESFYRNSLSSYIQSLSIADDRHLHKDIVADAYEGKIRWNSVQVICLSCGAEKAVDRRSWLTDKLSGLPVNYQVDQQHNLPVCPIMEQEDRSPIDPDDERDLLLLGPNHEIRLLLTRNDNAECLHCENRERRLTMPTRIIQNPICGQEKAVANSLLADLPGHYRYDVSKLRPVYKGFAEQDSRNRWYAWVEVEYWQCSLLPEFRQEDKFGHWLPCSQAMPESVLCCL